MGKWETRLGGPFFSTLWFTFFSCYWLLKGLGLAMIDSGIPKHLDHPLFHVTIAPVCSGVEGLYFFTFIFGITGMLHWKNYSRKALGILFLIGNGMMLTFEYPADRAGSLLLDHAPLQKSSNR